MSKRRDAVIHYRRLTKQVEVLEEEEGLAGQLNKSLKGGKATSKLSLTVKTTKQEGEVTTRNTHCSAGYWFKGLSLWSANHFKRVIMAFHTS